MDATVALVVEEARRQAIFDCAAVAVNPANISMVGGSTGDAYGTAKRIANAIRSLSTTPPAPVFDHNALTAKLEALDFNEQEIRAVNIVVSELLAPAAKENE